MEMAIGRLHRGAARLALAGVAALFVAACGGSSPDRGPADAGGGATATATAVAATPSAAGSTEAAYIVDARAILDRLGERAALIAQVLDRADVRSEAWRSELSSALDEISALGDEARDLDAPDALAALHQQLVATMDGYNRAADLLSEGLTTLDLEKIEAAALVIAEAIVAVANVRVSLDAAAGN